ncbi:hypothetical protein SAMN05216185_101190 [Pseudomonas guariconensis]|uniref:hypothetical protein n=1 Tax=Pseudomonas guariconensis TaxID=1288410 RepID=UPI000889533F|nr:hypothetical protein [Pseudomonas guariconensis]SDC01700.1 hypothetical protein SAMN05216185_101190 [Pseudomonas guariconensis]
MITKMGNSFPICAQTYAGALAAALRTELGTSHRAIKTLRHWTDASERTAKHWLAGSHGPSGLHLIELMRHSDHALQAVLELAQRNSSVAVVWLPALRERLLDVAEMIDVCLGPGSAH